MKKSKSIILGSLILLCIGVILFSLYNILLQYHQYKTADDEYEQLSQIAHRNDDEEKSPDQESYISPIDFEALWEINPDIIGWIVVEGTSIDYPIVQGSDNEVYLSVTYTGVKNSSGAIFLDCRNSPDFTDWNSVIYGHKMKNGTMFANLSEYKSQSFYEAHPFFTIYTSDSEYQCEVFAAYVTPSVSEAYTLDFASVDTFTQYLEMATSSSLITAGLTPNALDRIVTLSTCDYTYDDARMVVHARMIAT